MRAEQLTIPSLLVALLVTASCESKTGVLIQTSATEELGEQVVSLRYYVGKNIVGDRLYFADQDPLSDVELEGRNLFADPYRLLLTPNGDESEGDVLAVAALGLNLDGDPVGFARLSLPVAFSSGQVMQWDLTIAAVAGDFFVTETGCLKYFDERQDDYVHIGVGKDADCDGYFADEGDCDDLNPYSSPGAAEDCSNGIDDNCNGLTDYDDNSDLDDDGFAACSIDSDADCNDDNRDIHPGAEELCDGVDNDCNNACDEHSDSDGDSVTTCGSVLQEGRCVAMAGVDCNDGDDRIRPGLAETCDGLDNDCSGACDDDPALDSDGDRYTECGSVVGQCGTSDAYVDCDPTDFFINPGAVELCDGIDSDCDGLEIEKSPCFDSLNGNCFEGRRECNGGALSPTCNAPLENGNEVPDQGCTTYDDCQAQDPYECVLDEVAQLPINESCYVAMVNGTSCSGLSSVRIVPPNNSVSGAADCTYSLIGGTTHGRFDVSLLGFQSSGQFVQGCEANLRFSANAGALETIINIVFDNGVDVPSVIRVKLKAQQALTCGGNTGLMCTTWVDSPIPVLEPVNPN